MFAVVRAPSESDCCGLRSGTPSERSVVWAPGGCMLSPVVLVGVARGPSGREESTCCRPSGWEEGVCCRQWS